MLELETGGLATADESLQVSGMRNIGSVRFNVTPATSRGGIDAAKRHSARVWLLRRVAIAGSLLAIALIAGVALLNPLRRLPVDVSIGRVGIEGTKVTVESPKISGVQTNGSPFHVTAQSGIQDITTPNIIELTGIDSTLGGTDSPTTWVTAEHGVYDSAHDKINLKGDVQIKSSAGYNIWLEAARIDFNTGGLVSDEGPVKVNIDGGTVSAKKLDVSDNGHKVSFDGDVKSLIDTGTEKSGTASGATERAK
ncbi:MAG TPA: LPS export ABC transporter periplasmic protein LptC [Methylocella sp.]|nr:LPS export ABC transporter periplasmic protein LptC [Methylocella sp.]